MSLLRKLYILKNKIFFIIILSILLKKLDKKFMFSCLIRDLTNYSSYFNIKNSFYEFFKYKKCFYYLKKKNELLKKKILYLKINKKILDKFKQENYSLRKLLSIPTKKKEKIIISCLNKYHDEIYNDIFLINLGKENNVYLGQYVINEKGVIGKIISICEKYSLILPLYNELSAVPIKLLKNNLQLIAFGTGDKSKKLVIEIFNENDKNIKIGDILVTSELINSFPKEYPVAKILSINKNLKNLKTTILANPIVNFDDIKYVSLIVNS
ncbi:MAG: rod shape-determining protein MreC [Enterobacteriaceae bacterium]